MTEHRGRVRSARESFSGLLAAGAWVTAAEREQLCEATFHVVDVRPNYNSGDTFGLQTVFVIYSEQLWGEERRLLALASYPQRVAFAREIANELRDAPSLGPYRLGRVQTSAGHQAWRLVPSTQDDVDGE